MADIEQLQRDLQEVQEDLREAQRQVERVTTEITTLLRMVDDAEDKIRNIDGDLT